MKLAYAFLFVMMCFIMSPAAHAAKCSFNEDTNDFFSGSPTLRTKWNRNIAEGSGNAPEALSLISAVEESGNRRLEIRVEQRQRFRFKPTQKELDEALHVPAGAMVEITMVDGSVVELPALTTIVGQTDIWYPYEQDNSDYIVSIDAIIPYALDDTTMDALSSQKAMDISVHTSGESLQVSMPKRGAKEIIDAIKCLRQGDSK